jgi:hypothetical protein
MKIPESVENDTFIKMGWMDAVNRYDIHIVSNIILSIYWLLKRKRFICE